MSGNNQQTGENGAGLWIGCSSMSLKSIGLTLEIFLICTKMNVRYVVWSQSVDQESQTVFSVSIKEFLYRMFAGFFLKLWRIIIFSKHLLSGEEAHRFGWGYFRF